MIGKFNERRMIIDVAEELDPEFVYDAETSDPRFHLPARYAVCDACNGSGVTTSHIECDGGGFTSSEWAERCNDDPEFEEDYFSGVYDRPCPECNGNRVTPVIREENIDPEILKSLEQYRREEAQSRREEAYQRRYGF